MKKRIISMLLLLCCMLVVLLPATVLAADVVDSGTDGTFDYTFGTITPDEDILIAVYDSDGNVVTNAYPNREGKLVAEHLNASETYTYTIDVSGYETYEGTITSSQTQGEDIVLKKIESDVTYFVSDGVLSISGSGPILDYATWRHTPWSQEYHQESGVSKIVVNNGISRIGDRAFAFCDGCTDISIPETVTSIGDVAFGFITSLRTLSIPESVTSIGDTAFWGCTKLKSITIPQSVTSIGANAFENCSSLASVVIYNRETSIGDLAFNDCSDDLVIYGYTGSYAQAYAQANDIAFSPLDDEADDIIANGTCGDKLIWSLDHDGTLTIKGVGPMYREYFSTAPWSEYQNEITSVIIEDGVTSIAGNSFNKCANLTDVTIPSSVTEIGAIAFSQCLKLTDVVIPEGVVTIGDEAFSNMALTQISIPSSVLSIGSGAFAGNIELAEISVDSANNSYIAIDGVLFTKDMTILHTYPVEKTESAYVIPAGVTEIGDLAFFRCDYLSSVTIPDTVTRIGDDAFEFCTSLRDVAIPSSVTEIGRNAFRSCRITSAIIPNGVTSIEDGVFDNCLNLTSVTIPDSVTNIGQLAFYCCHRLENVYYGGAQDKWESVEIYDNGNDSLINATIHYGHSHNYTSVVTAPTCTESGYTTYTCQGCGYSYTKDETAATGHSYSVSEVVAPTCTEKGYTIYTCGNCGDTYNEDKTSATGHHYTSVIIAPTCTEKGYTTYTCGNCGYTYNGDETIATGHHYTSVVTAPTCTEIGYTTYTCESCGDTHVGDKTTAATGHVDYTSVVTAPTCTEIGYTTYTCNSCGETWTGKERAARHSFVEGVCNRCGCHIAIYKGPFLHGELKYSKNVHGIVIERWASYNDVLPGVSVDVFIPEEIDGIPVVGIRDHALRAWTGSKHIKNLYLPKSLKYIEENAFLNAGYDFSVFMDNIFYAGSEDDWNQIDIASEGNEPLRSSPITYNYEFIHEDDEDDYTSKISSVRYFDSWDAEKQIAYFDNDFLGSKVAEETDTSFLVNVDDLVGKYVLAQTVGRDDNLVGPDILLSIMAVETKTGTVDNADDNAMTITIDGVTYSINDDTFSDFFTPGIYVDDFVLYHICNGAVVGIEALETIEEGTLTYWNTDTRELIIDPDGLEKAASYTLSELADEETLTFLGNSGKRNDDIEYIADDNGFVYWMKEIEIETEVDIRSFQFGVDNLSFINNTKYFFNAAEMLVWNAERELLEENRKEENQEKENQEKENQEKENQEIRGFAKLLKEIGVWPGRQISNKAYLELTKGMSGTVKGRIEEARLGLWGGSCYGMAQVMAIRYLDADRLPLSQIDHTLTDDNTTYDLSAPKDSTAIEDLINYYHLSQLLPIHYLFEDEQQHKISNNYSACLEEIVSNLEDKKPVTVTIREAIETAEGTDTDGGHQVVLLEILDETDEYYRVKVCDPNRTEYTVMKIYKQVGILRNALHIAYTSSQNVDTDAITYNSITTYYTSLKDMDVRNYVGLDDYAGMLTDYDTWHLITESDQMLSFSHGNVELKYENGTVTHSKNMSNPLPTVGDLDEFGIFEVEFMYDGSMQEGSPHLSVQGGTGNAGVSLILDDWSISVISENSIEIDIDPQTQSVNIQSEDAGVLSAMLALDETDKDFPWYEIAIDVDNATELSLTACDDGILVSSDNLNGADVAVKNDSANDFLTVDTEENGILLTNNSDLEEDHIQATPTIQRYTVTFDPNGGTLSGESSALTESNGTVILPGDPARNGYTFSGWYTAANSGELVTAETIFTKETTIYAHWVLDRDPSDSAVPTTGISVAPASATLTTVGETVTLAATISPDNATNKSVIWSSSNPDVATVSDTGVVTAVSNGQAIITVVTVDGGYSVSCDITVNIPTGGNGGSGTSGGAGGTASYTVIVDDAQNGSVAASHKNAPKGTTVTITATSNEGYKLDNLTALDKNGKEIKLTNTGDGTYIFTMPAGKVTVSAKFVSSTDDSGTNCPCVEFVDLNSSLWYHEAVDYVLARGIMSGYGDGYFGPNDTLTRGMVAQLFYNLAGSPDIEGQVSFGDVADGVWYADAVRWAEANKVVGGYADGSFGPNDNITREQLASILYRYAAANGENMNATADLNGFADANSISEWSRTALAWANAEGLITGKTGNIIDAKGYATRAEIATILMRYIENIAE